MFARLGIYPRNPQERPGNCRLVRLADSESIELQEDEEATRNRQQLQEPVPIWSIASATAAAVDWLGLDLPFVPEDGIWRYSGG